MINYDPFVETLSGIDTLHDTVGIIYQFAQDDDPVNKITPQRARNDSSNVPIASSSSCLSTTDKNQKKKRRKLEEITRDIQPYYI